jgi:hypothetical protein
MRRRQAKYRRIPAVRLQAMIRWDGVLAGLSAALIALLGGCSSCTLAQEQPSRACLQ